MTVCTGSSLSRLRSSWAGGARSIPPASIITRPSPVGTAETLANEGASRTSSGTRSPGPGATGNPSGRSWPASMRSDNSRSALIDRILAGGEGARVAGGGVRGGAGARRAGERGRRARGAGARALLRQAERRPVHGRGARRPGDPLLVRDLEPGGRHQGP